MTFRDDDEFTKNLNERIKELEDMTNEMNDQTNEIHDQAARDEEAEETTEVDQEVNEASDARQEGDTIFFTAEVRADKPLKLNITNNNGDIQVTGTENDHVEISATRQSGEDVDHSHWFFQQVNNEITLRPNWQVGSHVSDLASKLKNQLKEGFKTSEWSTKDFKFGLDVEYDLVVRVPKNLAEGSRVNVKTANGDGEMKDIHADVDFKTANGDLDVANIGGSLTINSANGDLVAADIKGNAHATTANGDVKITDVTGSIEANTANGDVHVDGASGWVAVRTANGDARAQNITSKGGRFATVAGDIFLDGALNNASTYTFDTVTGDVNVSVRVPSSGATLSTKTLSGDIEATGEWTKKDKREWVIGEGKGPKLSAKSVSSDIHVHAVIDPELQLLDEEPSPTEEKADTAEERAEKSSGSGEININLDFEIERAKGWMKDMGTKLGGLLGEKPAPPAAPDAPSAVVEAPDAPKAPDAPEAPQAPEQKSATAERRAKLLEAVKNGEMTVDEALAELERDA